MAYYQVLRGVHHERGGTYRQGDIFKSDANIMKVYGKLKDHAPENSDNPNHYICEKFRMVEAPTK